MPLLPYCIVLGKIQQKIPATGVKGKAVHVLGTGELTAPYSELEQTEFTAVDLRRAALEFHEVVQTIFELQAVIPFRFPTWLSGGGLGEQLQQQAEHYATFLRDHCHEVQMEIRVLAETEVPARTGSGTEYLRIRSTNAQKVRVSADTLKAQVALFVSDWRERPTSDGLRLFALVDRKRIADFRERLGRAESQNLAWRVTGPWPATEFLPQSAQGGVQL